MPARNPFNNKVTFEFGDRTDDDDHGPAQRSAGIDVFAEAHKLNLEMIEFVPHLEEVAVWPSTTEFRTLL